MESVKGSHKPGWCWLLFACVLAALVVIAAFVALSRDFHFFRSDDSRHARSIVVDKYADALTIAMQFFDVQKCMLSFSSLRIIDYHFYCFFSLQN